MELPVADPGSTDGSLQVLKILAGVDSRLCIITRSDNVPADALNEAHHAACGTMIGGLNADDLHVPASVAGAVAALNLILIGYLLTVKESNSMQI